MAFHVSLLIIDKSKDSKYYCIKSIFCKFLKKFSVKLDIFGELRGDDNVSLNSLVLNGCHSS